MDSIPGFFSGTLQSWFGKGENWFRDLLNFGWFINLDYILLFCLRFMVHLLVFSLMIF